MGAGKEALINTEVGGSRAAVLSNSRRICCFIIISVVLFFAFIFYSLPAAFLPLYDEQRNVSSTWTGILIGAGPLSYIMVCPLSAMLLNNFSNKKLFVIPTLVLGVVTMLFSSLDYASSTESGIAIFKCFGFIMRCIQGTAGGVITVTAFAALVKLYPNHVATVTASAETVLNGALAFGPFLGSLLYSVGGFKLAFFVPGLMILVTIIPALSVPQLTSYTPNEGRPLAKVLSDPWLLFAAWHCSACQILLNYHIPILSPYVERVFDENVVWAGTALLINSGSICLSAPFLGVIIDRYNPYVFLVVSAIMLPIIYLFIGPLPLITFLYPSKVQLLCTLALLGFFVPMGCTPVLLVMFDIYKTKNGGHMSVAVENAIVSLYCASFPLGAFLGATISGIVAEYLYFEWSTGILGLCFFVQTVALLVYCHLVSKLKKREADPETKAFATENRLYGSKNEKMTS